MIKQTLYGKTRRLGATNMNIVITEKLDGANLAFFKWDDTLHIAQRNNIYTLEEALDGAIAKSMYKGLRNFLEQYGYDLEEDLQPGACSFGEFIGMGRIKYPEGMKKFYPFAKSNVEFDGREFSTKNKYYDLSLLKWSFQSQALPEYFGHVPVVEEVTTMPTVEYLDELYDTYRNFLGRDVEGFIVNSNNAVVKYVRMKNGKLTEHKS